MAVQDLTPQLRTRLGRVERAVGWFVILATLLLAAGFGYYIYHTARSKGWFLTKIPYFTYVRDATGLKVGDTVRLVGFDVGEIVEIEGTEAGKNWFTENNYNVFIKFIVHEPYYGYIWTDSKVRVGTGDFLGKRVLEVSKGSTGEVTVISAKGQAARMMTNKFPQIFDYVLLHTQPQGFWLRAEEAPALTVRLDQVVSQVELALPGFFQMTNQIQSVITNGASLMASLNQTVQQAQPAVSNLNVITAMITNGNGSLGDWIIPTNISAQLQASLISLTNTMRQANSLMATSETSVATLALSLNDTLVNLASITSNLNQQVQTNDQLVSSISKAIVQADELMQGLKRHWLLRSAFKEEDTNAPAQRRASPPPPKAGKWR